MKKENYSEKNNGNPKRRRRILTFVFSLLLITAVMLAGNFFYQKYLVKDFGDNLSLVANAEVAENPLLFDDESDNIDNTISLAEMEKIQQEALNQGIGDHVAGRLIIPKINQNLPILRGANQYTLSIGVATHYYVDAEMGKGNYVLAGHDMEMRGVMFSDLKELVQGDTMELVDQSNVYQYKVNKMFVSPATVTFTNGRPDPGSLLAMPGKDEKPILTLFTCIYTEKGKERYVVQGELSGISRTD